MGSQSRTRLTEQQQQLRSLFAASVENQQRQQSCGVSGQAPCLARSADTGKGALLFLRSHVTENHELKRGQSHHTKEVILKISKHVHP